jgi:undecaprenyl-diphosphatase
VAHALKQIDVAVSEQIVDFRWGPLTSVMLLISAWWVKDVVFFAGALAFDIRHRRWPWRSLAVGFATAIGALVANVLKPISDRPRPFAQHLWTGLGPHPHSSSMPSGHAATAAAAGVALAMLVPALRIPAVALALLVCLSRVYLGVHFAGDVLVGAVLGGGIATLIVWTFRRTVDPA